MAINQFEGSKNNSVVSPNLPQITNLGGGLSSSTVYDNIPSLSNVAGGGGLGMST